MMYRFYDKKDKRKIRILYYVMFLLMVAATLLSIHFTNAEIPSVKEGIKVGFGFVLIMIMVALAFAKSFDFIKFKGMSFFIIFLILLFFKSIIDTLIITIGFLSIPLLFDDLIIRSVKSYLNWGKYSKTYLVYMGGRNEKV